MNYCSLWLPTCTQTDSLARREPMVLAGEIQQTHGMTLKCGRRLVSCWAGKGCSLAGVAGKGLSGERRLALSSQSFREPVEEG